MATEKILVIHNAEQIAKDVTNFLQDAGYETKYVAMRGDIGLQTIYEFRPDLILCDGMLMHVHGYAILETIRSNSQFSSTLFVAITAMTSERENARLVMDLGADDYLDLPFTSVELLSCVKSRFRRRAQWLGLPINEYEKPIRKISHHVFISYSHKDTAIMQQVRGDFHKKQLTVWTDEDLKPGTPAWQAAIQAAIENTGSMVAILSPDAKQSEWVNIELGYARTFEIAVFPVLARGTERDAIPISLINAQFTDIRSKHETEFEKLTKTIKSHIGLIG